MTSLTPAKAIGIDKYKGSIETGKDAANGLTIIKYNFYNTHIKPI